MKPTGVCPEFSPDAKDACYCTCKVHWNLHRPSARSAFWSHGDQTLINMVISACKRDNEFPCSNYQPKHDWATGKEPAPDCICGRPPRPSHTPGSILKGIRAWRDRHSTVKQPCGMFYGSLTTPGTCSVCRLKWIQHPRRPLVIEAFADLHDPTCKSITMNGDVQCSCMDNVEIQAKLDKLGQVKEEKVACKQFRSKSTGNTFCGDCGEAFYMHTLAACNGHTLWLTWRASHLSNKELIDWFMALPGDTRSERVQSLKRFVSDPTFNFKTPANMVNPDDTSLKALLDALTGSRHIQSPADLEREARRGDAAVIVSIDDLPLNEEEKKYLCYSCGEEVATISGAMCTDCEEFIRQSISGTPANAKPRISNDKGGS